MNARQILRAEYGDAPNFMTPDVLGAWKVTHPDDGREGAVELSEGGGIAPGSRIYGVSFVWVNPDGSTDRDSDLSRCLSGGQYGEPHGAGYAAALALCREYGAKV